MSRKELEAKFLVKITLDGKIEITKDTIKNSIEDNVKGLKIKEVLGLKLEKDKVFAEIKSDLHKLLFPSATLQESKIIAASESKEDIDQKIIDCAMCLEKQLKLQKALNPSVLKLVENIEFLAKSKKALLMKNMSSVKSKEKANELKPSLLLVPSDKADQVNSLKRMINDLELEMQRLCKENEEIKDDNKQNKSFGSGILIEEINNLNNKIQAERLLKEEQAKSYSLKILKKDEEIEKLKKSLANPSNYIEEDQSVKSLIKDLEAKNKALDENIEELRRENNELKTKNKKLELNLVAALENLSRFEGATLANEQRKKRLEAERNSIKKKVIEVQEVVTKRMKSMDRINEQQSKIQKVEEKTRLLQEVIIAFKDKSLINTCKLKEAEKRVIRVEDISRMQDQIIKDKKHCINLMESKMNELTLTNTTFTTTLTQYKEENRKLKAQLEAAEEEKIASEQQVTSMKQMVMKYEQKYVEASSIMQKVWNSFNKMYMINFTKLIEIVVHLCERVRILVPKMKEVVNVSNTKSEVLNTWKKKAEQVLNQNNLLNIKVKELKVEIKNKGDKLEEYKQQHSSLKQVIDLNRKQEQKAENKIKDLESMINKMELQIKELEESNKSLKEIRNKVIETQDIIKQELIDTKAKLQDLVMRNENYKKHVEKRVKAFLEKVEDVMKRMQEGLLIQRLFMVKQKVSEDIINGISRMKAIYKESKETKIASEAELMKLSLEQERIQMKLKKIKHRNVKLEQEVKQYEVSLKEKNKELDNLNTKLLEVTKNYKNEKSKATILEDYLQKNKQDSTSTINTLKRQFKINYKRIENYFLDKAKHFLIIIQLFTSANKTLNKILKQHKNIDNLKDNYMNLKIKVKEMEMRIDEQEKLIDNKLRTEQNCINVMNEGKDKIKALEEKLERVKEDAVQSKKLFEARFKAKYLQLQKSVFDMIIKVKKDVYSVIENEILNTKHLMIVCKVKELKEKYKETEVKLDNDCKGLRGRLEAIMKELKDKEGIISILREELELSKEKSEMNKEEIIQLAKNLHDTSIKLKESELQLKNTKNALARCTEEIKIREEPLTDKAQMLIKAKDTLTENVVHIQGLNAELILNKSQLQETQTQLKKLIEQLVIRVKIVDDENYFGELVQEAIKEKNHINISKLHSKLNDHLKHFVYDSNNARKKLLENECERFKGDVIEDSSLDEELVNNSKCQCQFLKSEDNKLLNIYNEEKQKHSEEIKQLEEIQDAVKKELNEQKEMIKKLNAEVEKYKKQMSEKDESIVKLKKGIAKKEEAHKLEVEKYQKEIMGIKSFIEKSQTLSETIKKGILCKHNISTLLHNEEEHNKQKFSIISNNIDVSMEKVKGIIGAFNEIRKHIAQLNNAIKEKDSKITEEQLKVLNLNKEKDLIIENMKKEYTEKSKELENEQNKRKVFIKEQEELREQLRKEYKEKINAVNQKLNSIKEYKDQWNNKVVDIVSLAFKELAQSMAGMINCKLVLIKTIPQIEYKIFTLNRIWAEKYKESINKQLIIQDDLTKKYRAELNNLVKQVKWKEREIEILKEKCEQSKENQVNKSFMSDSNAEVRARLSQSFIGVIDQKKEVEALTKQLADLKVTKNKTIKDLTENHKKEVANLKNSADKALNSQEILNKEVQKLKQELQVKESLVKELQDKEQKATKAMNAFRASTDKYKQEVVQLKNTLTNTISAKDGELAKLRNDNDKEIARLDSLKTKAEQSLKQKIDENDKIVKEIESKDAQLVKLKEENNKRLVDLSIELKVAKEKCNLFADLMSNNEEKAILAKQADEITIKELKNKLMTIANESAVIKEEYDRYKAETDKKLKEVTKGSK